MRILLILISIVYSSCGSTQNVVSEATIQKIQSDLRVNAESIRVLTNKITILEKKDTIYTIGFLGAGTKQNPFDLRPVATEGQSVRKVIQEIRADIVEMKKAIADLQAKANR